MGVQEPRRGGRPEPVGQVLDRYLRVSGLAGKLRTPAVYDCWPEVVGLEAARHSRVVGLSDCVLHVEVDSAPWLQVLATFKKAELLAGMRRLVPGIRVIDIRFRVGSRAGTDSADKERATCRRQKKENPGRKNQSTTRRASRSSPE